MHRIHIYTIRANMGTQELVNMKTVLNCCYLSKYCNVNKCCYFQQKIYNNMCIFFAPVSSLLQGKEI